MVQPKKKKEGAGVLAPGRLCREAWFASFIDIHGDRDLWECHSERNWGPGCLSAQTEGALCPVQVACNRPPPLRTPPIFMGPPPLQPLIKGAPNLGGRLRRGR